MNKTGYINYILDVLSTCGSIRARKMFSGYGIYSNNICFALILDDVLYFKVQASDTSTYQAHGSSPFTYEKKDGKRIALSYWQVPENILEDTEQLAIWFEKAVAAAQNAKRKIPTKK